jgi:hypothetical protein
MELPMRMTLAVLVTVLAGTAATPAHADPYRWCGVYGGSDGDNGTNCYFMTLEQCRASVSGIGGFCTANNFYDGRPVTTPGEVVQRSRRPRH